MSILVLVVFSIPLQGIERNIWTLSILERILIPDKAGSSQLPDIEVNRQNDIFWLARLAVVEHDIPQVQTLVMQLEILGKNQEISILGADLENHGYHSTAIWTWLAAKDINSLWRSAELATKEKRLDDALLGYRGAVELEPEQGVYRLAEYYYWTLQNFDIAENILSQSLLSFPESKYRLRWLSRLGDYSRAQNKWVDAGVFYEKVLSEQAENLDAQIGMGWVYYWRDHNTVAALSEFQQAIAIAPDEGRVHQEFGWFLTTVKRYVEADKCFQRAQELDPDQPRWYSQRIKAAFAAGNMPLSINIYKDVVERFPNFALVHYEMSWIFYQSGDHESAIMAIEQALNLMIVPDPEYYFRAGLLYEWIGNASQAEIYYRAALSLNPNHDLARNAIIGLSEKQK